MTQAGLATRDFTDALPVGSEIGGYVVRRMLGHGGFGITYEADSHVTGRSVAIKEFFPASFAKRHGASELVYSKADEETIIWALRKFQETTTTLCRLSHPNIVQVVHYVPANNTGYMIMELVRGRTLKEWLTSRNRKPTLDELRPLLEPVMDALTYVHGEGLVHRDVAPDNILITGDGRPVLIDFGSISADLSRAGNERVKSTVGLSKRHFTAPEQMNSKTRPTVAADIYSLGAVLYLALCGDEPADGHDRMHTTFLRQEPDPFVPLARMHPAVAPPVAAAVIDTSLAMRPDQRPGTMAALRQGLWPSPTQQIEQTGGVSDRESVDVSSVSRSRPVASPPGRRPIRAPINVRLVAALAAIMIVVAVASGFLLFWPRPHSQGDIGNASQSAGSNSTSLIPQTGPTPSTRTRSSDEVGPKRSPHEEAPERLQAPGVDAKRSDEPAGCSQIRAILRQQNGLPPDAPLTQADGLPPECSTYGR